MTLAINSVIHPTGDNSPLNAAHRILWLSRKTDEIVLFCLKKPYGVPFFCHFTEVELWLSSDVMQVGEDILPSWVQKTEGEINERDKKYRKDRWELIDPLVTNENLTAIFDKALRGRLISKRAHETGKKREWFYPLLKLYWLYGQTKNALLPAFEACAKNGQISDKKHQKRGRRPSVYAAGHDLEALGVNVTKEDLRIFLNCLREYHLRQGYPITDTYDQMIEQYYSIKKIRDGEIFKIPIAENNKIKIDAFRYWSKKLLSDLSLQKEVMGDTLWKKLCRGKPSRASITSVGPSDIFEIDATPDNCFLVSEYQRYHLIGRAVDYYVVDRESTMITGFHSALEGPSWNAARFALYNTFTDKVEFCRKYGIEISHKDWPCQEICPLLVADQGEILSENAKFSLQNMLNIDTDYNAVGQADNKGTVESTHIKISEPIAWTPGAWRAREKDRKKYRNKQLKDDACLTLAERTRIKIYEILHHNNNVRVTRKRSSEMINANVSPYRRDIYLWGLENTTGEPRRNTDKTMIYRCLLPKERVSITEKGLKYKDMYYLPEGIDYELLLAQARKKRIKTYIHVDNNSSNTVYQMDESSGEWINWHLTDESWERYANRRLEDIIELHASEKFEAHDARDSEVEEKAIKNQKQRHITQNAKKEKKKASKPSSKSAYYKGARQNRMHERDIERAKLAKQAAAQDTPLEQDTSANSSTVVDIHSAMLRRRQKIMDKRKTTESPQ